MTLNLNEIYKILNIKNLKMYKFQGEYDRIIKISSSDYYLLLNESSFKIC